MAQALFDEALRELRLQRARRIGPVLFLAERAYEDLLERLAITDRRFSRALVVGLPEPEWIERFRAVADEVHALGSLRELVTVEPGTFDLCVVLGQFDTVDDLPLHLRVLRAALMAEALLVGAFSGNNSLPVLRTAMLAADRDGGGGVSPRVHPRIEASMVAPLLGDAGFTSPVVDIDRVRVRYRQLDDLVRDLRGMGATNVLRSRSRRPLGRVALAAARQAFGAAGDGNGTVETVEIVHFSAWAKTSAQPW